MAPSTLIAAGKAATIGQIDYRRADCGDDRRFEPWLKSIVGESAKAITWSAGRCKLVNKLNPIDRGGGLCARAAIAPRRGRDNATVEIYFERGQRGVPGKPFAFRASVHTKDGWDYMRDTSAFATNWRETYAPDSPVPEPYKDCD